MCDKTHNSQKQRNL